MRRTSRIAFQEGLRSMQLVRQSFSQSTRQEG